MSYSEFYESYKSEVDGQILLLLPKLDFDGYRKIGGLSNANKKRQPRLHIYEAQKVYGYKNLNWPYKAVVHHINGDRADNRLSNLSVFESSSLHMAYHRELSKKIFEFEQKYNTLWYEDLNAFFEEFPELELTSLEEIFLKED